LEGGGLKRLNGSAQELVPFRFLDMFLLVKTFHFLGAEAVLRRHQKHAGDINNDELNLKVDAENGERDPPNKQPPSLRPT
jgi:hypothetical protein